MKTKDLRPNPKNPRKISDKKLEMLKKALLEFGDLSGIVYNRKSGQLVGGHQRLKALPDDSKVTVTNAHKKPTRTGTVAEGFIEIEGERFTYREVEWDDAREKAANIAANKHGGEWDMPNLSEWLLELDHANFDLELTGFDEDDLANVFAPITQLEPVEGEDDAPEPPKIPKTVRGDLYQLGEHRLMCGDSTCVTDVERLMDGEKADMIWTDPPYNVAVCGGTHNPRDKKNFGKGPKIENDSMSDSEFKDFLLGAFACMYAVAKPGGAIYVAHADSEGINFRSAMKESGFLLKQCLIWVKQQFVFGRSDYHWQHEPILYGWKDGAAHKFYGERNQSTTWNIDRPMRSDKDHPTQKPVVLVEKAILNSSRPGHLLFEPFGGGGSTLIAAEKTQRRAFLMELDPKYCDVIVARWEKFTGKKAELIQSGSDAAAMEGGNGQG